MSINQLNGELLKLLALDKNSQNSIIKRLDDLIRKFGTLNIGKWRNTSNNRNSLLHELVEKQLPEVLLHVVKDHKLDVNVRRDSDGLTPLQLASNSKDSDMCDILKELGANEIQTEDVSKWLSDEDKGKSMNIVWVDLEMTSIEDPEILECAVIITDKDLKKLDEGSWVIHFDRKILESLGAWHQETFKSIEDGGNGLFADVLKSKLTKDQVEEELLALIKRHCPEKMCPLAGSSIHIDKDVLRRCMPKVHDYLHYRIIDVSSFQAIMRRWAPWMEAKIKKQLATHGQEIVNHRAMDDIIWSISFMNQFRPILTKQHDDRNRNNRSPINRRRRSVSPSVVAAQVIQRPRNSHDNNKLQLYADEKRLLERIEYDQRFNVKSLKLSKEDQLLYDRNPHLREVFMNKEQIVVYDKDFTIENRLLKLSSKRSDNKSFDPRQVSTTEHWGQRKLLLTEIEFLTNYGMDRDYLVVYAGSAPGSHINYLSSLFPQLEFVLIDDKDFSVDQTSKIQIRSEKFTNDVAKRYCHSKRNILFICNMHTFNTNSNGLNALVDDMYNQADWHKLMKPQASLLNFRVPNTSEKFQYFKGLLVIEPWASKRSTECRLIVEKDPKIIDYYYSDFENALFNFHNVKRIRYYKYDMRDGETEGLDHCYDCRAEIYILQEYITKIKKVKNDIELKSETAKMSMQISRKIEDKKRPSVIDATRTLDVIPKKSMGASSNE